MKDGSGDVGDAREDSKVTKKILVAVVLTIVGIILAGSANSNYEVVGWLMILSAPIVWFMALTTAIGDAVYEGLKRSAIVPWLFVLAVPVIGVFSIGTGFGLSGLVPASYPDDMCTYESIPFEYEEAGDKSSPYGYTSEITTTGSTGRRQICKPTRLGHDDRVTTISEPINQVTTYTAKSAPTYQYSYTPSYSSGSYRTGAICEDGSTSSATGRGACSWHGGVSEWLY